MQKIQVTDDGVGMPGSTDVNQTDPGKHISKGMKMTKQRLNLIGNITGHKLYIQIKDAFPGEKYKGTRVELLIPGDLS
jgi:hypothetical protein